MDELPDYDLIGLMYGRNMDKYVLYRVFIKDDKIVRKEVITDHMSLPSTVREGKYELDRQLTGLSRHKYEFPIYVRSGLKVS